MASASCEWGLAGVEALQNRASVLVIVDVLSFSTAVDVAVSRGAAVYPFAYDEQEAAEVAASRVGAIVASRRGAAGGGFSLSPASLMSVSDGLNLMLPSPNGSRLSLACGGVPVFAGCLRNAQVVAMAAVEFAGDGEIGVIAAGERWPDGNLRPAIEDLLGAGAILHHLGAMCSPEAEVALNAYRAASGSVDGRIRQSLSGRELRNAGFAEDVDIAVAQNVSRAAPYLIGGAYRAFRGHTQPK